MREFGPESEKIVGPVHRVAFPQAAEIFVVQIQRVVTQTGVSQPQSWIVTEL